MFRNDDIIKNRKGLTLTEMVISLAIMVVVMAALLPQIAAVNKSWDSRRQGSDALQNGRVLVDHLNRNLAKAVRIVDASEPAVTNGFLEFEDTAGDVYRYEVSAGDMVQFGLVGSLFDLAGPVSRFQVTCYDDGDLDTPIDIATYGVDRIRFIKTDLTLTNSAQLGQDKALTATAYLRTNGFSDDVITISSAEFNHEKTKAPDMINISGNKYLCAYSGDGDDGFAVVLNVDPTTWAITQGTRFEFDAVKGKEPELCKLNNQTSRFLCLYSGDGDIGWAVVLNVNMATWEVTNETVLNYEAEKAKTPALIHIKDEYYLCAYSYTDPPILDDGWASVLKVDKDTFQITKETTFIFDGIKGKTPSFAKIDDEYYLCAYEGDGDDGWVTVLKVDEDTLEITKETSLEFDPVKGKTPVLQKIDDEHYLCVYAGDEDDGWAVILNVNKNTFAITKKTPYEFNSEKAKTAAVAKINYLPPGATDRMDVLCGYSGDDDHGYATIFRVDTNNWTISQGEALDYDSIDGAEIVFEDGKAKTPTLIEVDSTRFLCAYSGGPPKIRGVPIDEGHDKEHGFVVTFDVAPPLEP